MRSQTQVPPARHEEPWFFERCGDIWKSCFTNEVDFHCAIFSQSVGNKTRNITRNRKKSLIFPPQGGFLCKNQPAWQCLLAETYLYVRPKVGHARNRSRTACFNERFLKQAILSSNKPGEEQVDSHSSPQLITTRHSKNSPQPTTTHHKPRKFLEVMF